MTASSRQSLVGRASSPSAVPDLDALRDNLLRALDEADPPMEERKARRRAFRDLSQPAAGPMPSAAAVDICMAEQHLFEPRVARFLETTPEGAHLALPRATGRLSLEGGTRGPASGSKVRAAHLLAPQSRAEARAFGREERPLQRQTTHARGNHGCAPRGDSL